METLNTKICSVCNEDKLLSEYGKQKGGVLGLRAACKCCRNIAGREYHNRTIEHQKTRKKVYRATNKEYDILYRKSRKHIQDEYNKQYYNKNKSRIIKQNSEYKKMKYHTDPITKVSILCRSRLNTALRNKGFKKTSKLAKYLGCTFSELVVHLESLFKPGMTWENHGEWHIDHIVPLDLGNNEEEILQLNYYKNLQPLWAKENISKGNKIMV